MERAGASKIALYQMNSKVRELHVNGAGKRPLWSKKWTILGILSAMGMLRKPTSLWSVQCPPEVPLAQ
jgi:hypothetical protein